MHRFPGRHLHHEADAERHGHRVLGDVIETGLHERALHRPAGIHHAIPSIAEPGLVDLVRRRVAVLARQPLPLDRERTVSLQVAERPVVAQHVEAVTGSLPRATGLVAAVRPVAHAGPQQLFALVGRHRSDEPEELVVREAGARIQDGGRDLRFALGIEVHEGDLLPWLGLDVAAPAWRRAPRHPRGSPASTEPRRPLGPRRPPVSGTPGSPSGAPRASSRRTRASPRAGAPRGASAAARRTARSRRSPRWNGWRPAGTPGACRTSSR